MTALKREVEQLKTMVNNVKDQVTRVDREHEERMDCHREDINWQKKECILLRVGLQENEDRMGGLSVRQQQMLRPPRPSYLCCRFTTASSLCKESFSGVLHSSD